MSGPLENLLTEIMYYDFVIVMIKIENLIVLQSTGNYIDKMGLKIKKNIVESF